MSKDKQHEPDGRVPVRFLNELNQFTVGGFILFYFNAADGCPEHVMTFDSHAHSLALQKYASDYCTAINNLNVEVAKKQIINDFTSEIQKDEEEGGSDPEIA